MPEATPACLESHVGSGVKGSAQDPNNGMTASLPLGSTHGLQIFVVWPGGGFSWDQTALGNRVSRPTSAQPWECVYMCVHTPTYTRASVEVSKLQTKVFYRGVLK